MVPSLSLHRTAVVALVTILGWSLIYTSAPAGDSIYGKVTAVKRADLIVLDYGAGTYEIRIAGLDLPRDRSSMRAATEYVSTLLLGKFVRLRFDGRTEQGEMVGKIYTDDPELGIRDVAVELVQRGLARRNEVYAGYRYNEMAEAEAEAREAKRGIWLKQ